MEKLEQLRSEIYKVEKEFKKRPGKKKLEKKLHIFLKKRTDQFW